MPPSVLEKPDPQAFLNFIRSQAAALRAKDQPPASKNDWQDRRAKLRAAMFAAMGEFPEKPCPLEAKVLGELKRDGYRVEKLVFQSRPDVWVTANAYVPAGPDKHPAVLVVHGHWPWARIDPVVQARCIGLVKLGFFVLAVDAFGAGERAVAPARGTYHGALNGSTLWPAGHTLLGMQVYDNRRAVDYLQSRPEIDGSRLGITGASGGGNQSMYAGALDERFAAVVPVCSVGTYQAYLGVACCVCEVLPGALRFCEEGDVLALVAPRALMVINATKDGIQFSVGEAQKSISRARPVFQLYGAEEKVRHVTFESPHAYNQPMREAMYGWMTRWLKNEGKGEPIPEPKHEVEKEDELRCYPDPQERPKSFLFPPSFAAREAKKLLAPLQENKPDHAEAWTSTAEFMRARLRKLFFAGSLSAQPVKAKIQPAVVEGERRFVPLLLDAEKELSLPALLCTKPQEPMGRQPACILLDLGGKDAALKHPLAQAFLDKGWSLLCPDLRATGETRPTSDAIAGADDHNSTEWSLWIGRPLLGQWLLDVISLLDWLLLQPHVERSRLAVAGLGPAGIVALCAAGLDDRIQSAIAVASLSTYVTEKPYVEQRMGLLAPGILKIGDIPTLAALVAPRRLILADSVDPQNQPLEEKQLQTAYAFTAEMYKLHKAAGKLTVGKDLKPEQLVGSLVQ